MRSRSSLRGFASGNAASDQPLPAIHAASGFRAAYSAIAARIASCAGDTGDVARIQCRAAFEHVDVRIRERRQQHAAREIDDARVGADEGGGARRVADVDDATAVHRDGFRHASLRIGGVDATAAEHPLGAVAAARGRQRSTSAAIRNVAATPMDLRIRIDAQHGPAGVQAQGGWGTMHAHPKERPLARSRHRRRRLPRLDPLRAPARRGPSRRGARRAPARRAVAAAPVRERRLRVRPRRRARRGAARPPGARGRRDHPARGGGRRAGLRSRSVARHVDQPRRDPAAAAPALAVAAGGLPDHQQRLRHPVGRRLLHRGDAARADLALRAHQGAGGSRRAGRPRTRSRCGSRRCSARRRGCASTCSSTTSSTPR